ncbi:MAG: hypothetical protein QOI13_1615, partial [Paraburkholderia sp.]|nr:hypothetical protein [Paraburkholderia sp.]
RELIGAGIPAGAAALLPHAYLLLSYGGRRPPFVRLFRTSSPSAHGVEEMVDQKPNLESIIKESSGSGQCQIGHSPRNDIEGVPFYSLLPAAHRAAFSTAPNIRVANLCRRSHRRSAHFNEYMSRQRKLISRFTPANRTLVDAYDALLDELVFCADTVA